MDGPGGGHSTTVTEGQLKTAERLASEARSDYVSANNAYEDAKDERERLVAAFNEADATFKEVQERYDSAVAWGGFAHPNLAQEYRSAAQTRSYASAGASAAAREELEALQAKDRAWDSWQSRVDTFEETEAAFRAQYYDHGPSPDFVITDEAIQAAIDDPSTDPEVRRQLDRFLNGSGDGGGGGGAPAPDPTNTTRGQFAVELFGALGIGKFSSAGHFNDATDLMGGVASTLKDLGITNGVGNNNFGTDQDITRGQAFVMMARAMGVETSGSFNQQVDQATKFLSANGIVKGHADSGDFDTGSVLNPDHISILMDRMKPLMNQKNSGSELTRTQEINYKFAIAAAGDFTTRGEFASRLYASLGLKQHSSDGQFNDAHGELGRVTSTLKDLGVTNGVGNNNYGSDNVITRGQAFTMIARSMGLVDGSASIEDASRALKEAGVISGYSGTGDLGINDPLQDDHLNTVMRNMQSHLGRQGSDGLTGYDRIQDRLDVAMGVTTQKVQEQKQELSVASQQTSSSEAEAKAVEAEMAEVEAEATSITEQADAGSTETSSEGVTVSRAQVREIMNAISHDGNITHEELDRLNEILPPAERITMSEFNNLADEYGANTLTDSGSSTAVEVDIDQSPTETADAGGSADTPEARLDSDSGVKVDHEESSAAEDVTEEQAQGVAFSTLSQPETSTSSEGVQTATGSDDEIEVAVSGGSVASPAQQPRRERPRAASQRRETQPSRRNTPVVADSEVSESAPVVGAVASASSGGSGVKVNIERGEGLVRAIQKMSNGQLDAQQAHALYRQHKDQFASMKGTYRMENGEVGIRSAGEFEIDADVANSIKSKLGLSPTQHQDRGSDRPSSAGSDDSWVSDRSNPSDTAVGGSLGGFMAMNSGAGATGGLAANRFDSDENIG